jgi:uncharacterized membrane protein
MIHWKSVVKTISWRCVATVDTFAIAWLITGHLDWASAIAGLEILTKTVLYYLHERGWAKIKNCRSVKSFFKKINLNKGRG